MKEIWIPSPNYSTGRGPYNKVVLHTTEGAMTIESLGSWFANPSAGCSSHHGADNVKANTVGAYVYEQNKAWTQGNANPYCLSLEMCAYASWSRDKWLNEQGVLLRNAASWVAWMTSKYGIPLRVLSNAQAQDPNQRGVCQHVNFGSWGSGHHDCGSGFPMDQVMAWAAGGSSSGGTPPPAEEDNLMAASVAIYQGRQYIAFIDQYGRVCVNGGVIDKNQTGAKSGAGIAVDSSGITVSYTNGAGKVCLYQQAANSSKWTWVDKGWLAK